jgi:hypothetical protein
MKRLTITLTVALGILALGIAASAAPKLVMEETEFNFGFVPQNSTITHAFTMKSVGTDTLKITKVVPGCGCTKVPLVKRELAPGESTDLEIVFSTKRYRNRVVKSPRIETNDGTAGTNVRIISTVVARPDSTYPIVIKPYKLDVSQFGEKPRSEMTFSITNVSEADIALSLIDRPTALFDIKLPVSIAAGETVEAQLKLRDDAMEESFEKSITLELDDEQASRFTIPVKRSVRTPGEQASVNRTKLE